MAAKPKLTHEQWASVKAAWEGDTRKGFAWLVNELSLPVGEEAVRQRSKQERWSRGEEKPSLEKQKPKLGTEKPSLEKQAFKKPAQKPKPEAVPEPEWEEVEDHQHGNSKYKQAFNQQAYRLCLLGAVDSEIADFFGVSASTINLWKLRHSEFSESLRAGKMYADACMAKKLYERGMGYSHPDVHVSVINNEVVLTELTKHYPPDTKAAFIWLKNRQPTLWRDKIEVENTHKLNPEMMDRIKTEFVERMAMVRSRQLSVLAERGLIDERELNADAGSVE